MNYKQIKVGDVVEVIRGFWRGYRGKVMAFTGPEDDTQHKLSVRVENASKGCVINNGQCVVVGVEEAELA